MAAHNEAPMKNAETCNIGQRNNTINGHTYSRTLLMC